MEPNKTAVATARSQHGVVASYQLRSIHSRSAIRNELGDPRRWNEIAPGVFHSLGAPLTDLAWLNAAILSYGPGSAVSHHSASWLWLWTGFTALPAHVVRPKSTNSKRPVNGSVRHESRRMPVQDLTVVQGLTVTTPARTLIDMAEQLHPGRVERMLDNAWSRRLVDALSLTECCDRLGARGRPGVRTVQSLVDVRGEDWVAPASNLESRVNSILAENGLGQVQRQVDVGGTTWLGRVDFVHPSGVILEVQSEMFHSSHTSMLDDRRRLKAMSESGYAVVEAHEADVWHRPEVWLDEFAREVRLRSSEPA